MFDLMHFTETEQKKILKSMTILVDSREKVNDHIISFFDSKKIPWTTTKLDHGDYSFFVPMDEDLRIPKDLYFTNLICIERKNNLDEVGANFSEDRAGVKKKFSQLPKKSIFVIENANYMDIINHNYKCQYAPQSYIGTIHSIWNEFGIPIIFMPDQKYTAYFIYNYFYYYLRGIIK